MCIARANMGYMINIMMQNLKDTDAGIVRGQSSKGCLIDLGWCLRWKMEGWGLAFEHVVSEKMVLAWKIESLTFRVWRQWG